MAFKIFIVGSSIRVDDLTENKIIISQPARDTWYQEESLARGVIQLYDDNSPRQNVGLYDLIFLSDAVDENNIPYTEETFRLFVYNNLGFNPVVFISSFITRGLALPGGFAVENNCY